MKEARHNISHIAWFHSCEISGIAKSMDTPLYFFLSRKICMFEISHQHYRYTSYFSTVTWQSIIQLCGNLYNQFSINKNMVSLCVWVYIFVYLYKCEEVIEQSEHKGTNVKCFLLHLMFLISSNLLPFSYMITFQIQEMVTS